MSRTSDQDLTEARALALGKANHALWQGLIEGLDKLPVEQVVMDYMIFLTTPGIYSHQDLDMNMARRTSVIRRVGPHNWDTLCSKAGEVLKMVGI